MEINRRGLARGEEDQEEGESGRRSLGKGFKRRKGSRGREIREKINRRGVSRGEDDQEEGGST